MDDIAEPGEGGEDHHDKEEDDIGLYEFLIGVDDPEDCKQGDGETEDGQDVASSRNDLRHGVLVSRPGEEEDVEDQEGHSWDSLETCYYGQYDSEGREGRGEGREGKED